MKRPTPPSRVDIAEYWWSKTAYDVEGFTLHVDIGEPCCWACGVWRVGKREGELDAYDHAGWLERCHLVPHARGGDNGVTNYVLLCSGCHKDMPNTTDRAFALKWVRNKKNWLAAMAEEFNAALTAADSSALRRYEQLPREAQDAVWKRSSEIRQRECVNHWGERMNLQTYAWALLRALDEMHPPARLQEAA